MTDDVGGALRDPLVDAATVAAYRDFLRRAAPESALDPYYSEEVVRFTLRDQDVVVTAGDARVTAAHCGAHVSSERARAELDVCGVSVADVTAIVRSIDGVRTAAEVRALSNVPDAAWDAFVSKCFGVVVFAPYAVAELEARVSVTEIVRYPSSPYAVSRTYWENMVSVREALLAFDRQLDDAVHFANRLRELHVLALLGEDRRSFYCPASPIVAKTQALPGELLVEAPVTRETEHGTAFVSGPRVNASRLGGDYFHALLAERVSDSGSLDETRALVRLGVPWGGVVTARAEQDAAAAPWFCPPRPLRWEHFESIRRSLADALEAAERGDAERALSAAAAVHWAFVRLHPFPYANQCIAMSLVNHVLRRAQGVGMPHQVLDHFALRLTEDAYERAFRRAAASWLVIDDSPVRRLFELQARRQRAFSLLAALDAAASLDEARVLIAERSADAALVCL